MKNLLAIELGILVIATVIVLLRGNFILVIEIIGYIGLIFMITAAILMGSFPSVGRIGADYSRNRIREIIILIKKSAGRKIDCRKNYF
ncbi:hypothetical protein RSJ42_03315 [Methanosarcina hadiensis]|uniref:hypothetical protein n=1 Tax=Methanosarcina hadiensis TaxID=3078083 RepID=UPI0039774E70